MGTRSSDERRQAHTIRAARPAEAGELAVLMNMAGEGIPAYLWSRMAGPGEDAMAFGTRRVARAEGGFSYTNAHVIVVSGAVAGMLVGYRQPDPYDLDDMENIPEIVRPLIELESLAPGSWYVNGIAVKTEHRGRNLARRLMYRAEELARQTGASSLSLIVAGENTGAKALYESLGYGVVARRPVLPYPNAPHGGDWLLMTKAVEPFVP